MRKPIERAARVAILPLVSVAICLLSGGAANAIVEEAMTPGKTPSVKGRCHLARPLAAFVTTTRMRSQEHPRTERAREGGQNQLSRWDHKFPAGSNPKATKGLRELALSMAPQRAERVGQLLSVAGAQILVQTFVARTPALGESTVQYTKFGVSQPGSAPEWIDPLKHVGPEHLVAKTSDRPPLADQLGF